MKKIYLLLLLLALCQIGMAQSKYSSSNYTGDWISGASWSRTDVTNFQNGTAPLPTNIEGRHYYIDGYITRYGDLSFANTNDEYNFIVSKTLVVTGSINFANKAMDLRIPAGGILIVFGDFSSDNQIVVENGGILIVKGNMTFNGGNSQSTYTSPGSGTLYVGGTVSGNATANTEKQPLTALPPDLWNFIGQNPGAGPITPLPIELLYFRFSITTQGIRLGWASAKEWDFSHYTLERSDNGRDYIPIHVEYVTGDSFTTKQYSFTDQQPQYGANYYRLKATDIDGTEEYKGVLLAYSGTKGDLELAPNPAKGGTVTLTYAGAGEATWLSILNTSGTELLRVQMSAQQMQLPVTSLSPGIYILKVWNQLDLKQARLVVP